MGLHPFEAVHTAFIESTKTLVRHYVKKETEVNARKELMFDEAFHVSKKFLDKAMGHSVESIQTLGHARVPSPPWVGVFRLVMPIELCHVAAQIIQECFGQREIEEVVGGREWWQQRMGRKGVEGEWIWIKAQENERRKKSKQEKKEEPQDEYTAELDDQRCIYYVHGGGYYFGSIDIYRYTIWRYARKIDGRAFALRYRLAPQYPFPCALQDALCGYLYLIRPPPGAKHKPVDPKKLMIAGDSAGGGLVLSLLCLLRDMKLPLPAGTFLVSPWLDLTHSFPSILQNTDTDIIPPYGFLHKPSILWPPPNPEEQEKIKGYTSVQAIKEREEAEVAAKRSSTGSSGWSALRNALTATKAFATPSHSNPSTTPTSPTSTSSTASPRIVLDKEAAPGGSVSTDGKEARKVFTEEPENMEPQPYHEKDANSTGGKDLGADGKEARKESQERTEPDGWIRIKVDGKDVELKDQIQFYAMNQQLTYPYVSPILQPSLGGLPPMLIICGDKEVLRDEIIYAAHRAAHPDRYPLRQALREANPARTKLGDSYPPTTVHLQVYDDMPHDLVLFSMASSAKYAYRSISSFCIAMTTPEDERPPRYLSPVHEALDRTSSPLRDVAEHITPPVHHQFARREKQTMQPGNHRKLTRKEAEALQSTIYSPLHPFHRPDIEDGMIRERVAIDGKVRPLEDAKELQACCMHPDDIGLIKEGPVKRYMQGKAKWEKKYPAKRIEDGRKRNVRRAAKEEAKRLAHKAARREKRQEQKNGTGETIATSRAASSTEDDTDLEGDEADEASLSTWARFDKERPPPSSIAARRDTTDAVKMASSLRSQRKMNPISIWTGLHDLASVLPPKNANADPDEEGESVKSQDGAEASSTGLVSGSTSPSERFLRPYFPESRGLSYSSAYTASSSTSSEHTAATYHSISSEYEAASSNASPLPTPAAQLTPDPADGPSSTMIHAQ